MNVQEFQAQLSSLADSLKSHNPSEALLHGQVLIRCKSIEPDLAKFVVTAYISRCHHNYSIPPKREEWWSEADYANHLNVVERCRVKFERNAALIGSIADDRWNEFDYSGLCHSYQLFKAIAHQAQATITKK